MEVLFTDHFQRSFRRLPAEARKRILEEVKQLASFPKAGKKLHGRLSDFYSLRVGDYRVVYSLAAGAVLLYDIGHRQSVYD